jgi:AcrR family transcriptional regulator
VPRLTRDQSHEQTRQKLLAAAREEIARKGVIGASVRSISEAAGYSQGAFYSCFDSKEALLLHLFEDHLASIQDRFEAVPDRIKAKIRDTDRDSRLELVFAEMDVYFESTNPGTTYASLAVELQLHANRRASFAQRYEAIRRNSYAAFKRIMTQIYEFLPSQPEMDPGHLALSLLSTGVGFSTVGPTMSQGTRRQILSTFFRAVVCSAKIEQRRSN